MEKYADFKCNIYNKRLDTGKNLAYDKQKPLYML